jgi:hypothetical protein
VTTDATTITAHEAEQCERANYRQLAGATTDVVAERQRWWVPCPAAM